MATDKIYSYFNKPKRHTLKEMIPIVMAKWARFGKIKQRVEKTRKKTKNIKLNFTNPKYSVGRTYYFPYSFETAEMVVRDAIYSDSIFSFLKTNIFTTDSSLNLYRSIADCEQIDEFSDLDSSVEILLKWSEFNKTDLSQEEYFKTLKIHNWPYAEFVTSATFFYLHNLSLQYSKLNPPAPVFSDLKGAAGFIAQLILSPTFGENVFQTIKQTNLFIKYPFECLYGFSSFIESECSMNMYEIENCNSLCSTIQYTCQGDFSGLKYYLSAFNSIIPYTLIKYLNEYCIETHSISLIYYTLKQYQNILDPELTDNDKSLENFVLSRCLNEEIASLNTVNLSNSSQLPLFLIVTSALLFQNPMVLAAGGIINPLNPTDFNRFKLQFGQNPPPGRIEPLLPDKFKTWQTEQIDTQRGKKLEASYKNLGWSTQKTASGLILATNGKVTSVVGNHGPYGTLTTVPRKSELQSAWPVLQIPCEVDHVNYIVFRTFCDIIHAEGHAICSTKDFNQAKQRARKGQTLGPFKDWESKPFSELILDQQDEVFNGAMAYYTKEPSCKEELKLITELGLLGLLKDFYTETKYFALEEMRSIADLYELGDRSNATIGTLVIPGLLKQLSTYTKNLSDGTRYKQTKKQLFFKDIIKTTFDLRWRIVVAVESLKGVVEPREKYKYSRSITRKLDALDNELKIVAVKAIDNYDKNWKKRGLPEANTDDQRSFIYDEFQRTVRASERLSKIDKLWEDIEYKKLNIGLYNSAKNFPHYNVAKRDTFYQTYDQINQDFFTSTESQEPNTDINSRLTKINTAYQKQEDEKQQAAKINKKNRTVKENPIINIAAMTGSENNFDVNPQVKPPEPEKVKFKKSEKIKKLLRDLDEEQAYEYERYRDELFDLYQEEDLQNQENSQGQDPQKDEHPEDQENLPDENIQAFPKSPGQEYLKETGRADWKVSQDEFNCDDESNCDNVDE